LYMIISRLESSHKGPLGSGSEYAKVIVYHGKTRGYPGSACCRGSIQKTKLAMNAHACPICSQQLTKLTENKDGSQLQHHCPVCGVYNLTRASGKHLVAKKDSARASAWIRQHQENRQSPPMLTAVNLAKITAAEEPSDHQKQIRLLRALEKRSQHPGQIVRLEPSVDYPLAWANHTGDFMDIIQSLVQQRFVRIAELPQAADGAPTSIGLVLTHHGWKHLDNEAVKDGLLEMVCTLTGHKELLKA
jgi:uncharacterized Zn finger protein (UPF0148 family)